MPTYTSDNASPKRFFLIGIIVIAFIVLLLLSGQIAEVLDANQVMVIQYPNGTLEWFTKPGPHWQWFGTVTKYDRQRNFWFSSNPDQGTDADEALKARFNDGAHATISGTFTYELPFMDDSAMTKIHTMFGGPEQLVQRLIRPVTEKAVYMTGPLMSSKESYSEKRNQLINFIDDQIVNGVYQTYVKTIQDKDPMTGVPRTMSITEIVLDKTGRPLRLDESPLSQFKVKVYNLSLNEVKYEERVEKQIEEQQKAIQQVQLAIAQAKEAEQKAITTAKQGEANAAEAKWKQETIKAQAITQAQQELEVAALDTKKAAQYKAKKILEAEADAEYKRKIIVADGALAQKLAAWVQVEIARAEAFSKFQGNIVPQYVSGSGGGTVQSNSALVFMELMGMKAAKDLQLDLSIPKK